MEKEMYDSMYHKESYHWYFKAKYEIVISVLEKYGLKKSSTNRIIDFGCGCGLMLRKLSAYGSVQGIDYSMEALDYCKLEFPQANLAQADLQDFFCSEKYDFGVALDVFEHIDDDVKAMKNVCCSLKKGGICIVTVPALMSLWSAHDKNCMHKRRYTKKELMAKLEESGFTVEYCSYYNFWSFPAVWLIRKVENILGLDNSASKIEVGFQDNWFNDLLYRIFSSEKKRILKNKAFPWGVSLICVVRGEIK